VGDHQLAEPEQQILAHQILAYLVLNNLEEFRVDLFTQQQSSRVIQFTKTQAHLLKDEISLFPFLHTSKRLDLEFLQYGVCKGAVPLGLVQRRQDPGNSSSLDFKEDLCISKHAYLSISDRPDSINQLKLVRPLQFRDITHGSLDHRLHGMLQKPMLLGEQYNHVTQQLVLFPIAA
jgi:hypothetical protein